MPNEYLLALALENEQKELIQEIANMLSNKVGLLNGTNYDGWYKMASSVYKKIQSIPFHDDQFIIFFNILKKTFLLGMRYYQLLDIDKNFNEQIEKFEKIEISPTIIKNPQSWADLLSKILLHPEYGKHLDKLREDILNPINIYVIINLNSGLNIGKLIKDYMDKIVEQELKYVFLYIVNRLIYNFSGYFKELTDVADKNVYKNLLMETEGELQKKLLMYKAQINKLINLMINEMYLFNYDNINYSLEISKQICAVIETINTNDKYLLYYVVIYCAYIRGSLKN